MDRSYCKIKECHQVKSFLFDNGQDYLSIHFGLKIFSLRFELHFKRLCILHLKQMHLFSLILYQMEFLHRNPLQSRCLSFKVYLFHEECSLGKDLHKSNHLSLSVFLSLTPLRSILHRTWHLTRRSLSNRGVHNHETYCSKTVLCSTQSNLTVIQFREIRLTHLWKFQHRGFNLHFPQKLSNLSKLHP